MAKVIPIFLAFIVAVGSSHAQASLIGDEILGCANTRGGIPPEDCQSFSSTSGFIFDTSAIVSDGAQEFAGTVGSSNEVYVDFNDDSFTILIDGVNFFFGNMTFYFQDLDWSTPNSLISNVSLNSIDPRLGLTSLSYTSDSIALAFTGTEVRGLATASFDIFTEISFSVPIPGAMLLLAIGLAGLSVGRRILSL